MIHSMLSVSVDAGIKKICVVCTVMLYQENPRAKCGPKSVLALSFRKLFLYYCSLFIFESLCIFSFLGLTLLFVFSADLQVVPCTDVHVVFFWVQVYKMKLLLKHCPCPLRFGFCCSFVEQHCAVVPTLEKRSFRVHSLNSCDPKEQHAGGRIY